MSKPGTFSSKKDEFFEFETQIANWLKFIKYDERDRYLITKSFLKGYALDWANDYERSYSKETECGKNGFSYKDVMFSMKRHFGEQLQEEAAIIRIQTLQQRRSVTEYNEEF
jgi:Retrotransposon gag protein